MSEWIKCSERMPEEGLEVLVFEEDGKCAVAFWCSAQGVGWYGDYFTYSPTHWMPLPEPPAP